MASRTTRPPNAGTIASKLFTPLGIVAAFVSLTETVLGYTVTQTTGGVQIALAVVMALFAFAVAGAFFLILWKKPYVFYAPSEYGDIDPQAFVDALHPRLPERVQQAIDLAGRIEESPSDAEAQFKLISALIGENERQHVILMHETGIVMLCNELQGYRYQTGRTDGSMQYGWTSATELAQRFTGTGIFEVVFPGPFLKLSESGRAFAAWLIANGKKADYYVSELGVWGRDKMPQRLPEELEPLVRPFTPGSEEFSTAEPGASGEK